MSVLSDFLAVLAALANATSSTLQRKANLGESDDVAFSRRLILDLLRNPVWFGGIVAVIAGFLLQAAALARGELAVVEPILALELPFTLALASATFRVRLHRREWTAAALMTVGLVLLVGSLRPRGGSAVHTGALGWGLGSAATISFLAVAVTAGVRSAGVRRAALLGVATGAGFGLTAAFMTGMSESLRHGLTAALSNWQTYAMVVSGIAAMWLLQNALQAGPLVVVQPGLTLTDPVVSILWGVVVFGERVHTGPVLVAAIAGGLLIVVGTHALSRSKLLQMTADAERPAGAPGPAGGPDLRGVRGVRGVRGEPGPAGGGSSGPAPAGTGPDDGGT